MCVRARTLCLCQWEGGAEAGWAQGVGAAGPSGLCYCSGHTWLSPAGPPFGSRLAGERGAPILTSGWSLLGAAALWAFGILKKNL